MQTLIALLGFAVLASIHLRGHLANKKMEKMAQSTSKERNASDFSNKTAAHVAPVDDEKSHSGLLYLTTEDFHKLQCYYAIALLIASFVALYGGSNAEKAQLDEAFLLLVSANGLIPVALTFYTLMLLRRTTLYQVILTTISALLASATGFWIVKNYSLNQPFSDEQWPSTCGALSPQYICGFEFELNRYYYPQIIFAVAAILCDTLIFGLVVWYTLGRAEIKSLARMKKRVLPKGSRTLGLAQAMLHTSAVIILLACTTGELFFFRLLLLRKEGITDMTNWGFGQIVGITVWCAVIVDLVRHEISMSELRILYPHPTNVIPAVSDHFTCLTKG